MKIRQTIMVLTGALLFGVAPLAAEESTNILPNGGFEKTKSSSGYGYEYDDWSVPFKTTLNTTDKLEGNQALQSVEVTLTSNWVQQSIDIQSFADGEEFEVQVCYKILNNPKNTAVRTDHYWDVYPTGRSDQDKDVLVDSLPASSEWRTIKVRTKKPKNAHYFYFRVSVGQKMEVLLDNFSLRHIESTEPYITVNPSTVTPMSATIGNTDSRIVKIRQGHVTGETKFELSYTDAALFTLSASSMPADKSELDLVITYKPTAVGNHKAVLNIDNSNHTSLHQTISLTASCSDPTKKPEITVTPTSITDFQTVVGTQQKKNIHIASLNCTSEIKLKMEHVKGTAFTCLSTGIYQNLETDEPITFFPLEEGEYESKLTISTEGAESIVVTLKGKAEKRSEGNIDWSTKFNWDLSSPLKMLNEPFDNIEHNKTLILAGWQNVAKVEERPWWGFDEAKTSPARGDNKYAKVTSYQYGKASTGKWESWLVTPALDYKNAANKVFTFSVMCEYQPDEGSESKLEVYYIDANISAKKDTVFFQDLTESFEIPKMGDENLTWRTFQLDLSPYAETMADIFHMGFRFEGPNGNDGVPTYYIDDVSWGRTDLAVLNVTPAYIIDSAAVVGKELIIGELTISGKNLTDDIELKVSGSNYNRFSLSTAKLGKEGGSVLVSFRGMEAGIHEAYVEISSKDAATKFVPMAVRCNAEQGVQNTEYREQTVKRLRDGQVIIVRDGKEYSILGVRLF